jgi:hypothetical protein
VVLGKTRFDFGESITITGGCGIAIINGYVDKAAKRAKKGRTCCRQNSMRNDETKFHLFGGRIWLAWAC